MKFVLLQIILLAIIKYVHKFFEITNKRNLADSYKIERKDFNQEIFISLAKLLSQKQFIQ